MFPVEILIENGSIGQLDLKRLLVFVDAWIPLVICIEIIMMIVL